MIEIVGVVFLWTIVSIIIFCVALRFFMRGCREPDISVKEVVIKDGDVPAFYKATQGCTCFYCFWWEKFVLHTNKDCVLPCAQRDFYKFDGAHFELNPIFKPHLDAINKVDFFWRSTVFYKDGKRYVAFDSPKSESIEAFYCPQKKLKKDTI